MHHLLSWLVPLAVVAVYLAWGLAYQAPRPETGDDADG